MNPQGCAIVSGATFGIGRAIALGLARRGWSVLAFGLATRQVSSVAEGGLDTLRAELGPDNDVLEADVADATQVAHLAGHALARFGRIGALVNNAAIGPLGTVADTDPALFDRILAVNLRGPFLMARAVVPFMAAAGGGAIVNIGSGAGWGKPNMAAYAASKGGLHALSQAMAYDHFHQRIRVNTVIPGGGGIVSGMSLGRVDGNPARLGRGAAGTAAGRPANGEDVAAAVAFLLSPEAATISGTIVDVGCFAHQGGPLPAGASA